MSWKRGTLVYPLQDMPPATYCYHQGQIVPYDRATVPIDAPAVTEAFTVFGLMVACWNEEHRQLYVHRLDRHCERLWESMKIAGLPLVYSQDDMKRAVVKTLSCNQVEGRDLVIRVLCYQGTEEGGLEAVGLTVLVHLRIGPFSRNIEPREVWIRSTRRIPDHAQPARAKASANYEGGRIAEGDLYLNTRGKVAELTTSCIFVVRGGRPATPRLQDDQLESVTRDTFIRLLQEVHGLAVEQREIDRSELYLAEEAWGGASGTGIFPIVKVDGRQVGSGEPGPIFAELKKTFYGVHDGTFEGYGDWRTPVY